MYSVVLMMALSGSADMPAFGHRGCHGCTGAACCGSEVMASCGCTGGRARHERHARGRSGCTGYVVEACGCSGGHARHARHAKGCCGCTGYVAPACGGCGYAASACGSCGAAVSYGCAGYAAPACASCGAPVSYAAPACASCGAPVMEGTISAPAEGTILPTPPPAAHEEGKEPEKIKKPKGEEGGDKGKKSEEEGGEQASLFAPVTLNVNLPAEAKLSIDGFVTTSTAANRTFTSPALQPGQDYEYTLQGELVRDGQTVTATRQITVHAGDEVNVTLDFPVSVARK
ncbi:MAG: TIGR03000 domain-containing protein [Planctomycetes bacterium]|nr:TIGR03000 domain-containing protein [Planctomycetota bacterium]